MVNSTPYWFNREKKDKQYTVRLVSEEELEKIHNKDLKFIEIDTEYRTNDGIVKEDRTYEIIDISVMGQMLGKFMVGIGWKKSDL